MHFLCFSSPTVGPCAAPACLCLCASMFMCSCLSSVRNWPTHESVDYAVISLYWRKADNWTSCNQERSLGEDGVESCSFFTRTLDSAPPRNRLPFLPALFVPGVKAATLAQLCFSFSSNGHCCLRCSSNSQEINHSVCLYGKRKQTPEGPL